LPSRSAGNRPSADKHYFHWRTALLANTLNRRWGTVSELGPTVVFFAAPASICINGHILYVKVDITVSL
jgi:hypothetical protein